MDEIKASKFISLVLRHKPEVIGIALDSGGYADTKELIRGVSERYKGFDMEALEKIVREDNKQRYSFNADKTKIRANQGHSLKDIDLGLEERRPPDKLYHGTAEKTAEIISAEGIKKMSRQYVHLSADAETAVKVGQRHGKPVVFEVAAGRMAADGHKFYLSENKVWLTDLVPPEYIFMANDDKIGN